MTRKLYYEDQYLSEFSATVTELSSFHGKKAVLLDRTAFFPESGGQSSDRGFIGGCEVKDVQIENDEIFHLVDSFGDLNEGDEAEGRIDFRKRFSDMQQHTAEHIFSGIIHKLYGLENVGFHLGEEAVTFDFPRVLTEDELEKVELLANRAIWENRKVKAFFPSEDELNKLSFRSKKEISEALRLVEIEGIDLCACCAPHVSRTGEIGIAKIIGTEKIRGGSRIYFLAGERALADIKTKMKQNKSRKFRNSLKKSVR